MKAIFTGDFHYGLVVEDLERTNEVHKAFLFLVDYAIEQKVDFVSICGDLTDTNYPMPDHIALIMNALNRLEKAKIKTYVSCGNHEAVSEKGRHWALTPLEQVGYKYIQFIKEPTFLQHDKCHLLFIPHATKATAIAKGHKTPQDYLDCSVDELLNELDRKIPVTAITHHNVNGAKAGTEALRLRQSDLQIPKILMSKNTYNIVRVYNSHIHSPQEFKNITMPGSLICTDFGDVDDNKGFVVGTFDGKKWTNERVKTPQAPLQEYTIEFDQDKKLFEKLLKDCADTLLPEAIVKVKLIILEEHLGMFDEDHLRAEFQKKGIQYIKKVDKIIGRKREIRDAKQQPTLSAPDAIKLYIKNRKPENADRKIELAIRIIAGEDPFPERTEKVFKDSSVSDTTIKKAIKDLPKIEDMDLDFEDELNVEF